MSDRPLSDAEFAATLDALASDPGSGVALEMLAGATARRGEADRAVAAYRRLVEVDPQHRGAWLALAAFHDVGGRNEEACAACRSALALDDANTDAWRMLGHLSLRLGQTNEAVDAFRRAQEQTDERGDLLATIADSLAKQGRWDEAERFMRRGLVVAESADGWNQLGDILFNRSTDGLAEAEAAYRHAIALAPEGHAAHRGLGECLARSGRFSEARDAHDAWIRYWLDSTLSSELRHRQDAARKRDVPAVAFVAMQKSASEFLRDVFMRALDVPEIPVTTGTIPVTHAVPASCRQLALGGAMCRAHLSAPGNVAVLAEAGIERVLVHVRDPRQVAVSWTHMIRRVSPAELAYSARMYDPAIPGAFPTWSFRQQLDWTVEHYLPGQVQWVEDWIRAADESPPIAIIITTFEEFHRDRAAYYRRIFDFLGISNVDPDALAKLRPNGMRNFRKGRTDEWQALIDPARLAPLAGRIAALAARFGWPA